MRNCMIRRISQALWIALPSAAELEPLCNDSQFPDRSRIPALLFGECAKRHSEYGDRAGIRSLPLL